MRRGLVLTVMAALAACNRSRTEAPAAPDGGPSAVLYDSGPVDAGVADAAALAMTMPVDSAVTTPPGPMIVLKGGTFTMGSDYASDHPEEYPAHRVTLPAFRIDVTPVTVAAYRACVNAGACKVPPKAKESVWWVRDTGEVDHDPMTSVTWQEARDYCLWSGKDLPTEEQWEYACAGRTRRRYPWGPNFDWLDEFSVINHCHQNRDADWSLSCEVGINPQAATPEGVQDLRSETAEWTLSPFRPSTMLAARSWSAQCVAAMAE